MIHNPLDGTLPAAFFGFIVGGILYGITVAQAYQYYSNTNQMQRRDSLYCKLTIGNICLLDTLHIAFATHTMYSFLVQGFDGMSGTRVIWSFKAMGSVQVFLVIFTHWFYLMRIWKFVNNPFMTDRCISIFRVAIFTMAVISLVVGTIFTIELQGVKKIYDFPLRFQYTIYLGFGTMIVIDSFITASMCWALYKSRLGSQGYNSRMKMVSQALIQYFIGTGMTTSFCSLLCIVLYVSRPKSILYLVMEFSITRLYANSVLAMLNARRRLNEKPGCDVELNIETLCFGEPEPMPDHMSIFPENIPSCSRFGTRAQPGPIHGLRVQLERESRYQTV